MEHKEIQVRFLPDESSITTQAGGTLLDVAVACGIVLDTPCGGGGRCGKCKVRFVSGEPWPTGADREFFVESSLREGWRLACCAVLDSDCVVEIPDSSLLSRRLQVMASSSQAGGAIEDDGSILDVRGYRIRV